MKDVQEYRAALNIYVRTTDGERSDMRDHMAAQLAAKTDGELLLLMECGDLAAIMSNGVMSVDTLKIRDLKRNIGKPKKLQLMLREWTVGRVLVCKTGHSAEIITEMLLQTPEGAKRIVKIAAVFAEVLAKNDPANSIEENTGQENGNDDVEQGSLFDGRGDA